MHKINKELIDAENKVISAIEAGNTDEVFLLQKELINKNREWREELLKNVGRDFIEKTVGDLLARVARGG